jgi:hypothetical protein
MTPTDDDSIIRHVRGQIVIHKSPFSDIEVPQVEEALSEAEYEEWVIPICRVSFRSNDAEFLAALRKVYARISVGRIEQLLSEFDWRPRLTGAFLSALRGITSVEDQIGRLLLRSDLCYAGKAYCMALASFNSPIGLSFLERYLDYYLTRPDLDYDQGVAIGAIAYLDQQNGTDVLAKFRTKWDSYVEEKSWKPDLEDAVTRFSLEMSALDEIRAATKDGS